MANLRSQPLKTHCKSIDRARPSRGSAPHSGVGVGDSRQERLELVAHHGRIEDVEGYPGVTQPEAESQQERWGDDGCLVLRAVGARKTTQVVDRSRAAA